MKKPKKKKLKPSDADYVDNQQLYDSLVEYRKKCRDAENSGRKKPKLPDYIGECIWLIANRLSTDRKFIGYTYREEMIGDAIENCLRYLHNFDPNKSKNPFAYFTAAVTNSFVRIINIEKRNQNIRDDMLEMNGMNPSYSRTGAGEHAAALKRHNEEIE